MAKWYQGATIKLFPKKRKEFRAKTRKEALKKAKGYCQKCGRKLRYYDIHHVKSPAYAGSSKQARVLCLDCHRAETLKYKYITRYDALGQPITVKVKRKPTKKK